MDATDFPANGGRAVAIAIAGADSGTESAVLTTGLVFDVGATTGVTDTGTFRSSALAGGPSGCSESTGRTKGVVWSSALAGGTTGWSGLTGRTGGVVRPDLLPGVDDTDVTRGGGARTGSSGALKNVDMTSVYVVERALEMSGTVGSPDSSPAVGAATGVDSPLFSDPCGVDRPDTRGGGTTSSEVAGGGWTMEFCSLNTRVASLRRCT